MVRYGTVEIGGTKTSVGVGSSPQDLTGVTTIATTTPTDTLDGVIDILRGEPLDALGIAAFGPLDVQAGRTGDTPKVGWSGVDLVGRVREALDVPIGIDTDVNGAALGEGRWGAGRDLTNFAYVTVGTGIGGGALLAGEPIHGLGHPEMGHITVRRHHNDDYPGSCRFHGDCLEGLASGPAVWGRTGVAAEDLQGEALAEVVTLEAFYLAQLMRDLVYVVAPERIVVGGGVSSFPGLHDAVQEGLTAELAGYPDVAGHGPGFIVPPALGSLSGLAGGLVLAERAASAGIKSSG